MKELEALLKKEETLLDRFAKELIDRDELDYDEIHAIFSEYGKAHGQLPGNFPPPLPGPGEDKTKDGPGRNTAQNPKP